LAYLVLVEVGKKLFFARPRRDSDQTRVREVHRLQRRAARFSTSEPSMTANPKGR
jgi:hypothetical protein